MGADVEKQLGRREAMAGISAAAVAVVAGLPEPVGAQPTNPRPPVNASSEETRASPDVLAAHGLAPADPSVLAFLGSTIAAGAAVEEWNVEAVYAVRRGGIPLVLSTRSGRAFAVEVFRAGAGEAPLGSAGPLALYLVNRGDGSMPSDEAAGLGVAALARALEARLAAGAPIPEALTSLSARHAAHPAGVFHIPT